MVFPRVAAFSLIVLAGNFPAPAQSVVSTHSGTVYFFEGSVFLGDQRLEQKFGKFPDIGLGRPLRTERGRAEVLLVPGVILRVDENSSIRMLSDSLVDARVELLGGSAILESDQPAPDTAVKLIHKDWQVWVPGKAVYRIDSDPPEIQVYKGEVKVSKTSESGNAAVSVKEAQVLPLAAVLVADDSVTVPDSFKDWAMNRSQAVSADNAVAADIIDDPTQGDVAGLTLGGFTYFPTTGYSSLGIASPYGMSFWSPYQATLLASCYQSYTYGPYSGWPSGACLYPRIPIFARFPTTSPYLGVIGLGGGTGLSRGPYRPPTIRPLPVPPHAAPIPHVPVHSGVHR
jgi:hypothetical protein